MTLGGELGITNFNKPILEVWNKTDLLHLTNYDKKQFNNQNNVVLVSAKKKCGIENLKKKMSQLFNNSKFQEKIFLPFSKSQVRSWLFEKKLVLKEKVVDDGFLLSVLWNEIYKNKYLNKISVKED